MFRPTLVLVATLLAFAACSSDKKNDTPPDSSGSNMGGSDAPTSTCATPAYTDPSFDFDGASADNVVWVAPVTNDLGDGGKSQLTFEFYSGTDLTQTIDLASGDYANYKTCAACLRLVTINDAGDMLLRAYFQSGGTIKLTGDPLTTQHLTLTATDVSLDEVMIDPDTYESTPVPGGKCLSLGSFTLDRDNIPTTWTCAKAKFNDGASCDCECGRADPDCSTTTNPVVGCTAAQVCGGEGTCIDKCSVFSTPPVGCPANHTCGIVLGDPQDLCYASDDPFFAQVAVGADCASDEAYMCAVTGSIATGFCDYWSTGDNFCRTACDTQADCGAGKICQANFGAEGVCATIPANDTCATATTLTVGTEITGTTAGATANYDAGLDAATCTNGGSTGRDVVYKVNLTAGTTYTVTLANVSTYYDASISIAGPGTAAAVCGGATITCLKGADAGAGGDGETFNYAVTTTGTYYIFVDSFSTGRSGTYSIKVAAM